LFGLDPAAGGAQDTTERELTVRAEHPRASLAWWQHGVAPEPRPFLASLSVTGAVACRQGRAARGAHRVRVDDLATADDGERLFEMCEALLEPALGDEGKSGVGECPCV